MSSKIMGHDNNKCVPKKLRLLKDQEDDKGKFCPDFKFSEKDNRLWCSKFKVSVQVYETMCTRVLFVNMCTPKVVKSCGTFLSNFYIHKMVPCQILNFFTIFTYFYNYFILASG